MKPEQKFWRNTVMPTLSSIPGLKYERIESSVSVSVPDVVVCGYDRTYWVELKIAKIKKGNIFTLPTMTVGQNNWISTWGEQTEAVFVFAQDPTAKTIWVFDHNICNFDTKTGIPLSEATDLARWGNWGNTNGEKENFKNYLMALFRLY